MRKHYRAIILVFACETHPLYQYFKRCWLAFHDSHPDVKVFFVYGKGSGLITNSHDLCYESVEESALCIEKVLYAFEHIDKNFTCDHFIRTNLSTFWRFDKLLERLNTLPKSPFATGALCVNVNKLFRRTSYLYGWCIIFDGSTLTRIAQDTELILSFKNNTLIQAISEGYIADDLLLTLYLIDYAKVPFIGSCTYKTEHFFDADYKRKPWDEIEKIIDYSPLDSFRVKSEKTIELRMGYDDRIFGMLTKKYYGIDVPYQRSALS